MTEHLGPAITVGRYRLHRQIGRGGMATIHLARLMGDVGFSRLVAAKRLHPELAEDGEFATMFLDEARIASKVHHRNVVPVLDVVASGREVVLVQEYVHGAPLSSLLQNACAAHTHVPIPVAVSIACQVLAGLHAAHETLDEMGAPLGIVHRDVSPQNIMVATDGTARLLDFGVAKAATAAHVTRKGTFKGKLAYSAPEQIRGAATRQSDIYSLAIVLWELLVGRRARPSSGRQKNDLISQILSSTLPSISQVLAEEKSWIGSYRWGQIEELELIVNKGIAIDLRQRWATALEMEEALAEAVTPASASDVAAWLRAVGQQLLDEREREIASDEVSWRRHSSQLPALPVAAEPPIVVYPWWRTLHRRYPKPALAVAGVLTVLLAIGLGLALRDPDPAPPVEDPAELPVLSVEPIEPAAPAVAPAPPTPPHPPAVRAAAPRVVDPPRPKPAEVHPAPRPAPAPKSAAPDCTTPYYFKGKKKLFKPACL